MIWREEPCSEEDFDRIRRICAKLQLRTLGDLHDCYLYNDVLCLADVCETFRDLYMKIAAGLDPFHSLTLASATYRSMLRRCNAPFELITERNGGMELMECVNENTRGGLSCVFHPLAMANTLSAAATTRRSR